MKSAETIFTREKRFEFPNNRILKEPGLGKVDFSLIDFLKNLNFFLVVVWNSWLNSPYRTANLIDYKLRSFC